MFKCFYFMNHALYKRFHCTTSRISTRFLSKDSRGLGGKRQVDRQTYKTYCSLRDLDKNIHSNSLILQTNIQVNNFSWAYSFITSVSLCEIIHMHKHLQNLSRGHFASLSILSSSFSLVIYIVHTSRS